MMVIWGILLVDDDIKQRYQGFQVIVSAKELNILVEFDESFSPLKETSSSAHGRRVNGCLHAG